MSTHYAHVLAGTGGSGTEEDSQRPVTLDGLLTPGSKWEDITGTEALLYIDPAPGQIVVRVEGDAAALDAIASAPGNVELFRDDLPQEVANA
jgi:hypothetical protein